MKTKIALAVAVAVVAITFPWWPTNTTALENNFAFQISQQWEAMEQSYSITHNDPVIIVNTPRVAIVSIGHQGTDNKIVAGDVVLVKGVECHVAFFFGGFKGPMQMGCHQ